MVRGTKYWNVGILSSRFTECFGRSRIEEGSEDRRLETINQSFQVNSKKVVSSSGFFCVFMEAGQLPRLVSWLPQPEESSGIRFSSLQSDKELPIETGSRPGFDSNDMPILAKSTLVSDAVAVSMWHSTEISSPEESTGFWPEPEPSSNPERDSPLSRLETLRRGFRKQGFPRDVTDLLFWNTWRNCCIRRDHNPISGCINQALAFLTEAFNSGRAYSTCNIYRSMLSRTIKLGPFSREFDLGKDSQIVKLVSGIYSTRPPTPKYTEIWDPVIVLNHMRSCS